MSSKRDKVQNSHDIYLEFTAVSKPDDILYSGVKLSTAVHDSISCINTLIKGLETQDEDRGFDTCWIISLLSYATYHFSITNK